ncbi:MAG TPA: outer membrane beta-barrel protein [Candidatus Binatia bacterium]|nr:outer membrane beta-barrel protein [Candidatus Binatia bacterium]
MRKFTLLAVSCALFFFAGAAFAQQVDVFIGGGTLISSTGTDPNTLNPPERGGLYLNLGGDVVIHQRVGFNVETAWRATQGTYGVNTGLNYRPILTDFNLLYQPRLGKKAGVDLLAGIGAGDTRLYAQGINGLSSGGYANYVSADHFMEHLGVGIRYYVWKHVFVRPEFHYYHIQSNTNPIQNGFFSSDNVFRAGASVGYTFGGGD